MAMSPPASRRRTAVLLGLTAIALAGCGTTVPQTSQLTSGGGISLQSGVASGDAGATAGAPGTTDGSGPAAVVADGATTPVGSTATGTSGAAVAGTGSSVAGPTATVAPVANARTTTATTTVGVTKPGTAAGAKGATPAAKASATSTAAAGKASAAPVAAGPLQLGFLDTETGNASALGINTGQSYSNPAIINALVKAVNAQGGIAGRQIQAITADTDTGGANWATEFQAACSTFTQDNHVAAVLGYEFVYLPSFETCLSQAGIPHLNEAYASGNNAAFTTYPMLFSLATPSLDRQDILTIAGPLADGELTTKNKLGILYDTCGDDSTAFNQTMVPYIKSHGLDLAASVSVNCASGVGDAGGISATVSSAVLNFRADGVDRVIVSGVAAVVFATEAQSQGYTPDYLLTSTTGGGVIESDIPAEQEMHMHGYGWLPEVDVDTSHQPAPTAAQKRCLSLLASQQIVPQQFGDYFTFYTFCDSIFAYQAAVAADGGRTDGASITAGLASLGSSYQSATTLNNTSLLSPSHHDDPTLYQPWSYNTGCSCFTYTGSPMPFPTS